MKPTLTLCFAFFQLLFGFAALSQPVIDSTRSTAFNEFSILNKFISPDTIMKDSVLMNAFFYDQVKYKEVFIPRTGNTGSAAIPVFPIRNIIKPINGGFDQFNGYLFDPLFEKPVASQRRFTNINYHIGSKKEQHIRLMHEQKFKPWLIAGLDFGALTSQGDYARQLNSNRNFDIYFRYESRSKVYRTHLSFTSNRILNQENGGITNDSIFENATSLNTRTIPIHLTNASVKHRLRDYLVKQELNLTNLFSKKDSLQPPQFNTGSLVLSHAAWWHRKSMLFTLSNPDSGYFKNFYFDTVITYDSAFINDLYQVAMLEYTSKPFKNGSTVNIGAGYEIQEFDYSTGPSDTTLITGSALVQAGYSSNKFKSGLVFSQTITGDIKNSYKARLHFNYLLQPGKFLFYLNLEGGKIPQTARSILYHSNHFKWQNDFGLLEFYDVTAGVTFEKIKLDVYFRSQTSKNFVFYREDFLPQTYNDFVAVNQLAISHIFRFGKVGWDNKIWLSQSGNENVVPVPAFSIFSSIYYHNRFFKNVLGFRAGMDVQYNTEYYGYGYMPATGIFHLQNEKQIGDYPQLGAFVHLNIKSKANLFLRLDHFNAGIGSRTYYGALHYPLQGRTFKFGVMWDLVD